MAFKKVNVTLHHIFNDNTGDDNGEALEVYGRFVVERLAFNPDIGEIVTLETSTLFDRSSGNYQSIVEGTAFIIGSFHIFESVPDREFLRIAGWISDQDDIGSNDELGTVVITIPFNSITSGLVEMPMFEESNQRVSMKMSTQVLAQW